MVLWDAIPCTLVEGNNILEASCKMLVFLYTTYMGVTFQKTTKLKFTILRISNLIWQVVLVLSMKAYGVMEI